MNGPVLIMAGGTGGHVFPALAVADALRARGVSVVWLGTHQGLEARIVPAAGIPMEWVSVVGLRGKGVSRLVRAPFIVARACWQALKVMRRLRPRAVLGMGGFVSGPGGLMAKLLGRPLCIHEQNAIAGMTNRWLARIADGAMEAFPGSLPRARSPEVTGNPVRAAIAQLPGPETRFAGRDGPLRVLVLGGSQGARSLNEMVPEALAQLAPEFRPAVRHQCGERHLEAARSAYQRAGVAVQLSAFLDDMAQAYSWADVVVCRAGALTVSELAAAGVGSVLVPYPYAVDDHQTANARYLSEAGAAVLVPDAELSAQRLLTLLSQWNRPQLLEMARRARILACPDAADRVAERCLALAEEGRP